MIRIKVFNIIFGLTICSIVHGQNLILNANFEEFIKCPIVEDEFKYCKWWFNPSKSSPDYFNSCGGDSIGKSIVGIPYNFMGKRFAHSGNAYVGLAIISSEKKYREYIQTKLSKTLKADYQYRFSFWLCMADSSHYKLNGMRIMFSTNNDLSTSDVNDGGIILSSKNGSSLWCDFSKCKNQKEWVKISGIFTAKGGEEFLTIGIFKEDSKKVRFKRIKKSKKNQMRYGYYYFDDLELIVL